MASNCSVNEHYISLTKSKELNTILDPYVHRVDSSELRKDLPPMQQVVLHVRQTSLQSKIYRAHKRFQRNPFTDANSFLKQYATLRPVHNHPVRFACAPFLNMFSLFQETSTNITFLLICLITRTISGKSFICETCRSICGSKKANRC